MSRSCVNSFLRQWVCVHNRLHFPNLYFIGILLGMEMFTLKTWTSLYKGSRYCTTLAECVKLSNIETSFKPSMWEFLRKSVAYSDRWAQWISPKSYNNSYKEGTWMWLTDSMTSNSYSLRKESLSMNTSLPEPWRSKSREVFSSCQEKQFVQQGRLVQNPIKLTHDNQEFWFQLWKFLARFSVYNFHCPSFSFEFK